MRLKFLVETTVKLDSINSKTYPADWQGEVPEPLAADILGQGLAVHVPASIADIPPGQQFTPEQAAVLAIAAEEALAAARAEQGNGGDVVDGEGDAGEGEPIKFDELKKDELIELALVAGVDGAKSMRKDELIEALKALQTSDADA